MKDKVKGLIIGITIGSMLTGVSAYAAGGTTIKGLLQKANIYVDGSKKVTTDTITYNNTTYVPVRSISNAIGEKVSLNNGNLFIGKQPTAKVNQDNASKFVYNKIKKDADKYNLHFMDEGTDGGYYVVRAFEDMPTHIATYGWYYVDMLTGDVYNWDLASNDLTKL